MLNGEKFSSFLKNGLWTKAANTATLLDNNLLTKMRDLSPFQQFLGGEREVSLLWCNNLKERCITTNHNNSWQAKLANCVYLELLVGLKKVSQGVQTLD